MQKVRLRPVRAMIGIIAAASLAFGVGTSTTQATGRTGGHDPSGYVQSIERYAAAHPNDFVGLDAVVFAHTGRHMTVQVNKSAPLSAVAAQQIWDSPRTSRKAMSGDYPSDVFDVALSTFPANGGVGYMGSWNWRDDFVGQGEPFDIANLQFDIPDCAKTSSYSAGASTWDGDATAEPTLRDANIAGHAPIWNVDARVSDFENSADSGYVMATADLSECGGDVRVGGSFAYEGNIGGSLLNVSAGWGLLGISYASNDLKLQKSTQPRYDTFEFTGTVYGDFPTCWVQGDRQAREEGWPAWRCVRQGNLYALWAVYS